MASHFSDKETYQKDFDPKAYLEMYYAAEKGHLIKDQYLKFVLKNLFNTFTSGGVKGNLLIDIGTGPTIYQLLSACESFKEIIATDYTDRNRQELETWLKKEPGAFDWSSVVKSVCELEGDREKWAEKEDKLRRTVTQVLKCDVTKKNPLDPLVLPQADCLLTCLCLEGVKGNLLIDIGTGPSIYHLLSACESFNEIIATDYTDRNRQELETWLKKEPGAFDWSSVVKFVCELEGDREKWAEKEDKLRRTVARILKCDVTKKNSLDPLVLAQADCLLTCLCLEGACKDPDTYCSALRNISSLLKPGGHLVMGGVLGNGMYMVGEKQFSGFPMDKEFLEKAVSGEGYVVEQLEVQPRSDLTGVHLANYNAIFFVLARKMSDKQSS